MQKTVVLQTDFGFGGGGAMAGVIKSLDPHVQIYDYNHHIESFNVRDAAYSLSCAVPFWPAGTIFVSVVDPGVGTRRRSCVARMKNGCYIVTPDNGTLTSLAEDIVELREIDETVHRLPGSENVCIFHGRDIYAYTAGKLAAGLITYEEVGPAYPVTEAVLLPLTNIQPEVRAGYARGGIFNLEVSYGCLRVNIKNSEFQKIAGFFYGDKVQVTILDKDRIIFSGLTWYERTFGDVPDREPMICGDIQCGDRQTLRFTINNHSFIDLYAPELRGNIAGACDYVFLAEKPES